MSSSAASDESKRTKEFDQMNSESLMGALNVLKRMRVGEKLSFEPLRIDPPGISSTFMRWWNSEGRERTILGIEALYKRAFHLIDNENNKNIVSRLIDLVNESIGALHNISATYGSDQTMVGNLDGIKDALKIKLTEAHARHSANVRASKKQPHKTE